jgi:asparagine synthase (glutamine-hydrolysing)
MVGDFALAWFDRREQSLLLARDPLGQRPLFCHQGGDFFAFASMPKGLHALDSISRAPDYGAVQDFLTASDRAPAQSYFAAVERVPPGHAVLVTPHRCVTRRYWTPRPQDLRLRSRQDYVDAYRETLDRAVTARLRSRKDVIATHLSSGFDSGAVTATAARLHSGTVCAFTAVPPPSAGTEAPHGRPADEFTLAASVAAMQPRIEHHRVESDGASLFDQLENGSTWFERPIFNLCNHGWLSQVRDHARERGAEVLLSGEIGNWTISARPGTALADYRRDQGWRAWSRAARRLRSEGWSWRSILGGTLGPVTPPALMERLNWLSSNPQVAPLLSPAVLSRLEQRPEPSHRDRRQDQIAAFLAMDFGEHRKGILGRWKIDKRDPTADVRLIEFCLSLPSEMLIDETGLRPLARAALGDRLPRQVLEAPAKGYQGADWHMRVANDLDGIDALIAEILQDAAVRSLIDVDRLARLRREWPENGWGSPTTIATYRNRFLQGLTAGHFLLRATG